MTNDGPETIWLIDRDERLVDAWNETFRELPQVRARVGDYFQAPADAMVAPGNSFGIMDGGLDRAIAANIVGVERRVREVIETRHHGELHVGAAELVETNDPRWPWLVYAPTMRVPDDVARTTNAYVAFRAILLSVRAHNLAQPSRRIASLVCCGLCSGIGAMPPRRVAVQMRVAYRQMTGIARVPSFDAIHETHRLLRTVD